MKCRLRYLLSLDEKPERLALAFAAGVFLALTPFVGLHTLLALALALCFGLNRAALLLGLFINNPWTLVPYYTAAAYLGSRLIGHPKGLFVPDFDLAGLWHPSMWLQYLHHWRLLMPMALGSIVLAVLGALFSYPLAVWAIKRGRAYGRRQSASDPVA
jgi:uncharacterized protein (DUF2062 family)